MKGPKRNNACGIKGKSGRKPDYIEKVRTAVVNKSWDIVNKFLNDSTVDNKSKLNVAVEVVKRTIPQEIKGELNGTLIVKTINYAK